eukprot:2979086-Alexandrium_andersonii.AAC.1
MLSARGRRQSDFRGAPSCCVEAVSSIARRPLGGGPKRAPVSHCGVTLSMATGGELAIAAWPLRRLRP